ncbi:MAG: hypothetical protein ACR2NN_06035 [Bryobacteraceae bacterium]
MSGSEKLIGLRATLNPTSPWWQLPLASLQDSQGVLIGWILETPSVDDGIPAAAATILVRAITALRRITFLDGEAPKKWRVKFPLRTTSDPEIAMSMFDMAYFSWSLQSQIGFLSRLDAPPPALTDKQVRAAFDRLDPLSLAQLGVTGLLLPAVDGDFAALALFDGSWPGIERNLQEQCSQAGVQWDIILEAEFKDTAWFASSLAPGLRR